ncbi:MAG: hypothetical protein R3B94_06795 [Hyphomonas sp.]
MPEDYRPYAISSLIAEHVKSPSLRHIRDPYFIDKLAKKILRAVDRKPPPWTKWDSLREAQLTAAATTWIPIEDLRTYLTQLPGEPLTQTDVAQRLRDIRENGFGLYPNDELREACLDRYKQELDMGTEMAAIIGALEEFVEDERERMRIEHAQKLEIARAQEREAAKQRLLSGADCKWTPLNNSNEFYCRTNGRLFKLNRGKEKRWVLSRVQSFTEEGGAVLGSYSGRGDATKAVAQIAYQAEPRY